MADEKPVLKRFANLDIDGVDTPKRVRPKRKPPAPPTPTTQQRSTSSLTTGRVRRSQPAPNRQPTTPPPGQPYRETISAPARRAGPSAPRRARGPIPGQPVRPSGRPAYRPLDPSELPTGGGRVMTIEMDLRQPRQVPAYQQIPMTPGAMAEPEFLASLPMRLAAAAAAEPARDHRPPAARRITNRSRVPAAARPVVRDSPDAPVTITELAARQLRLVAHQAGMADAALRLLTAGPGGTSQCEFALETDPPGVDDVVFLSQGIRIIVDQQSLRTLEGTRITCADLMI